MVWFLLLVVLASADPAILPPLPDSHLTASSSVRSYYPYYARVGGTHCGWMPAVSPGAGYTPQGEWWAVDMEQPYRITSFLVEATDLAGCLCYPLTLFNISYSLDGVTEIEYPGNPIAGPTVCPGSVTVTPSTPIEAQYFFITVDQDSNVIARFELYGAPLTSSSCSGTPSSPYTTYDTCTNGEGDYCDGTCDFGYVATSTPGPRAQCLSGVWTYPSTCVAMWPAHGVEQCAPANQAGAEVITPLLADWSIVEGNDLSCNVAAVCERDHLYLHWTINASYRLVVIQGYNGVEIVTVPTTPPVPDFTSLNHYWVRYVYDAPCQGHVYMRIAVGSLEDWGFSVPTYSAVTGWHIDGEFFLNITRPVESPGPKIDWQEVEATFAFTINLANEMVVSLDPAMTVYGLPNVTFVVLLFQESPYATGLKELTMWYLITSQFPYQIDESVIPPPPGFLSSVERASLPYPLIQPSYSHVSVGPQKGAFSCDPAFDLSPTAPSYCYQLLKVKYVHFAQCSAGPVTWTGLYSVRTHVKCRPAETWCSIPVANQYPVGKFDVLSNDICVKTLEYDPTTRISITMKPYPTAQTVATVPTATPQTLYVADNPVYLWITMGQRTGTPPVEFDVTEVTLKKLVFYGQTVYDISLGGWLLGVPFLDRVMDFVPNPLQCNGVNKDTNPACNLNNFPVLHWKFILDNYFLGLLGAVVPVTVTCVATVELDYEYLGVRGKMEAISTATFNPGVAMYLNTKFPTTTTNLAGSTTGTAVAVTLSVIFVVIAISGAVFIAYRRKQASAHAKLAETPTTA